MYGLERVSEIIFLQNWRSKSDAARIFSDLPAQLTQVCSPSFPLLGEALTYHYRQHNQIGYTDELWCAEMQELGHNDVCWRYWPFGVKE